MPIYEYECSACGHRLDVLQKMSDQPLTDCPVCHKSALQKLVSPAGFQLKGTGWYATDFRDKGKKAASNPDVKTTSTSDDKSSSTDTGTK